MGAFSLKRCLTFAMLFALGTGCDVAPVHPSLVLRGATVIDVEQGSHPGSR